MLEKNRVKEKLANGELVLNCMALTHAPSVVEILGASGFDMVCIDGEHGPLDRQTLEHLVRAAECAGLTPIFRTTLNYHAEILPFLDTGVMGVMVPHCTTAEKAKMAVDAVKYAPLGRRGMTPGRANAYAVSGMPAKEYIEASNRETLVFVQIEDAEGVRNLAEIIQVEGVDVLEIGAGDLSASLGYPGQRSHPKVLEVMEQIIDQAHAAGKVTSNNAPDPETRRRWFDKGSQVITLGDGRLLYDGATAKLTALRDSLQ